MTYALRCFRSVGTQIPAPRPYDRTTVGDGGAESPAGRLSERHMRHTHETVVRGPTILVYAVRIIQICAITHFYVCIDGVLEGCGAEEPKLDSRGTDDFIFVLAMYCLKNNGVWRVWMQRVCRHDTTVVTLPIPARRCVAHKRTILRLQCDAQSGQTVGRSAKICMARREKVTTPSSCDNPGRTLGIRRQVGRFRNMYCRGI